MLSMRGLLGGVVNLIVDLSPRSLISSHADGGSVGSHAEVGRLDN